MFISSPSPFTGITSKKSPQAFSQKVNHFSFQKQKMLFAGDRRSPNSAANQTESNEKETSGYYSDSPSLRKRLKEKIRSISDRLSYMIPQVGSSRRSSAQLKSDEDSFERELHNWGFKVPEKHREACEDFYGKSPEDLTKNFLCSLHSEELNQEPNADQIAGYAEKLEPISSEITVPDEKIRIGNAIIQALTKEEEKKKGKKEEEMVRIKEWSRDTTEKITWPFFRDNLIGSLLLKEPDENDIEPYTVRVKVHSSVMPCRKEKQEMGKELIKALIIRGWKPETAEKIAAPLFQEA
jgi:hypothetical protein